MKRGVHLAAAAQAGDKKTQQHCSIEATSKSDVPYQPLLHMIVAGVLLPSWVLLLASRMQGRCGQPTSPEVKSMLVSSMYLLDSKHDTTHTTLSNWQTCRRCAGLVAVVIFSWVFTASCESFQA
jgi:hypothetical protein